jgi:hypothetical protein
MNRRITIGVLLLTLAGCGKREQSFRFADTAAGKQLAELLPPARVQSWPLAHFTTAPIPPRPSATDRVTLPPAPMLPAKPSARFTWTRVEPQFVSRETIALADFPAAERVTLPVGPLAQASTPDPAVLPPLTSSPMPGEPRPSVRDDPTRELSRALRLTTLPARTNVLPISATLPDPDANVREVQPRQPLPDNDPPQP